MQHRLQWSFAVLLGHVYKDGIGVPPHSQSVPVL